MNVREGREREKRDERLEWPFEKSHWKARLLQLFQMLRAVSVVEKYSIFTFGF